MENQVLSQVILDGLQFSESFFDEFVDMFLFSTADPFDFTKKMFRNTLSVPCIFVVLQIMKRASKLLTKVHKDDKVKKTKNDVDYTMKKLVEKIILKINRYEEKNEFADEVDLLKLSNLLMEVAVKNENYFFDI